MKNSLPRKEWEAHRRRLRYERRLATHRLVTSALLLAAVTILLVAGFALAGRQ